tara:strand:+ start:448 stop:1617 length:1170 start_codon:yes stop_codon:yes gene_type:complete
MAKIPRGENKLTAGAMFYQRNYYRATAYPTSGPNATDMWYDKNLYGKVNRAQDGIIINEEKLKQIKIPDSDKTLHVLDFVADAFKSFRVYYTKQMASGRLSKDTIIYEIKPTVAWRDAEVQYHEYMRGMYRSIASAIFRNRRDKIVSVDSFLKILLDEVERTAQKYPITQTGFVTSQRCSPMTSGMMIELSDKFKHGTDREKYTKWIQDPNFKAYRQAARMHGFMVDKNAPWRLVSDIFSSSNLQRLKKRGVDELNFFDNYFYLTHVNDIVKLILYTYNYYLAFAGANPNLKTLSVEGGLTKSHVSLREVPTLEKYKKDYDMAFWIGAYYRIRIKEMGLKWDEYTITREVKKVRNMYKHLDYRRAVDYINHKTKGYYYPDTFREPETTE